MCFFVNPSMFPANNVVGPLRTWRAKRGIAQVHQSVSLQYYPSIFYKFKVRSTPQLDEKPKFVTAYMYGLQGTDVMASVHE